MKDLANRLSDIEVVGKSDSVPRSDFKYLMLAIAVESCPLNSRCISVAPVEVLGMTSMGYTQATAYIESTSRPSEGKHQSQTFVWMWEADDQGSKLGCTSRGVDVGTEFSRWTRVYLNIKLEDALYYKEKKSNTLSLYNSAMTPRCCSLPFMKPGLTCGSKIWLIVSIIPKS